MSANTVTIDPDLQSYCEQLDAESLEEPSAEASEAELIDYYDKVLSLLRRRVLIPSGTSEGIVYRGNVALVIGEENRDQIVATLCGSRMFKDKDVRRVDGNSYSTVYRADDSKLPVVFQDDRDLDGGSPNLVPLMFPDSQDHFPITHVFHISDIADATSLQEGLLKELLLNYPDTEEVRRLAMDVLSNVTFVTLINPIEFVEIQVIENARRILEEMD